MSGRSTSAASRPWTRRLLHPFVIMPVVAAVAVGVWWFAIRDDAAAPTTTAAAAPTSQLTAVTSGAMNETVSAEGTVAAAQTDDLSFSASGTVTAVNVKAGDTVTAGQVLATIDSSALQAAVTSAESDLADAQAKLSDDQAADASDEQLAADIASVATSNDAVTKAKDALSGASLVATFDGTVSTVDLTVGEELSSSGQGGTTLTGSGTGSGRSSSSVGSASTGRSATPSTATTTSSSTAQIQVVSSGRFEVEVSVDSADIGSVAVGQSADVRVTTSSANRRGFGGGFGAFGGGTARTQTGGAPTAGTNGNGIGANGTGATGTQRGTTGATATGTVSTVSQIADASSGVAGYKVTVAFTAPATEFYVGSSVTADIVTAQRTDVLQVPTRAVTTDDNGSTVSVSTDGTVDRTETRSVSIGLTANGMTEITSGLKAGEQVVISFPGRGFGAAGAGTPTGRTPTAAADGANR